MLHVAVGRKGEAPAGLTLRVQRDQLAGDVLDGLFRVELHALPCPRAELVYFRRLAVLVLVLRDAVQRVDVYQQHVVVAVDELDRLVHLAVLDRPRQSPEAADAVVDVHDVIAYFQRVEFLNRQAFASVQLAPDTVALVAVEYLVVGVETVFRRMVDEPRVQCQRNGVEDDVLLSDRVEDVRQPLDLSLVVGEQTGRIASQTVRVDVVGQQIEFLVEFGLGRRVERDADFGGPLADVVAQQHESRLLRVGEKSFAAGDQRVDRRRLVQIAENLRPDVVEALERVVSVGDPVGDFSREPGQRDAMLDRGYRLEVRNDLHLVERAGRELRADVERPDRVDLVAEKVDPIGFVVRIGENVDDAAANRVLSRFVDELDPFETAFPQRFLDESGRQIVPSAQLQYAVAQPLPVGDFFGQRLGICAQNQRLVRRASQCVERRRALYEARRVLLSVLDRALVARWKEKQPLSARERIEVVVKIARRIPVFGDQDVDASETGDRSVRDERQRRSDQRRELYRTPRTDALGQLPESLLIGENLFQLGDRHMRVKSILRPRG